MKKLIFVHGDKGGVGKSTFARLLADFYSQQKLNWQGFDCDSTNGHLIRFYEAFTAPVLIRDASSIDQIMNGLEGKSSHLLVDLGARSGEIIEEWMQQTDLLALRKELGFSLTIAFVLSPIKDSTALLKLMIDSMGNQANYVIVRNLAHGKYCAIYDESKTRQRLREELNAIEIEMPELLDTTYQTVDRYNLSWNEALADSRLQLAERQRIKGFLKAAFAEIEKARDYFM